MFLVSTCSYPWTIYWTQMLSGEWRCSWSSADRRCSNYIWVIKNWIAFKSAPYIKNFTVFFHYSSGLRHRCISMLWKHSLNKTQPSGYFIYIVVQTMNACYYRKPNLCFRTYPRLIIVVDWRIYASVNWAVWIGLSPVWCEVNIWNYAGFLLIGPLGTNFSEVHFWIECFVFQNVV